MYNITLEINQICNLNCTYCYLGDKNGNIMTLGTAQKSVDLAFEKVKVHRDRKIWFDFIGGEVLLSFNLLKDIAAYIHERNRDLNYDLMLSLTTNATLLNQEIVDWLVENEFNIKISIDGTKGVNDINRIDKNNRSVHDTILSNMKYLKDYEMRSKKLVQVTNVITKNNYHSYYESMQYITETLGFRVIDTALDETADWNDIELDEICDSIYKGFELYVKLYNKGKGFVWGFLEGLKNIEEKVKKFYYCGAGIISLYVRTDGDFYACCCYFDKDKENHIGNVNAGFYKDRLDYLKNLSGIDNLACNECSIYDYCRNKGCVMKNLEANHDADIPVYSACYMEKFKHKFYNEKRDILLKILNGEFIAVS